jgi:SAM-dependent methyltransferase
MKYQTDEKIKLKFKAIKEPKSFWKGKVVLDIGCNEGLLYPLLKKSGVERYIGIDNSNYYIDAARRNFPEVEFLNVDLRSFECKVDIAIALSTLHIFDNGEFAKILEHYSTRCKDFIFEVPVKGEADIYYTRDERQNTWLASCYFNEVVCYGVSPSPHDKQSTRKVFKCTN